MIGPFNGEYRFLSNFWPCFVWFGNIQFLSVEAAYQAAKTNNITDRRLMATMSPAEAKKYGRTLDIAPDWEAQKLFIMEDLVRQKFAAAGLRAKLLSTGDEELVEVNTWGDRFWGVCRGVGENHLGKILMKVRGELARSH